MENKINIAQLLKDCPNGMELDCAMWNNVRLKCVDIDCTYPIVITYQDGENIYAAEFSEYGCWNQVENAKCVIFPKGKTTWEGFVPPCEFKDGDIIFTHADSLKIGLDNTWISIFKENSANGVITYAGIKEDGSGYYDNTDEEKGLLCSYNDIVSQRFATEEEKQKLFDAIKANGYKWNAETKTLEKLVKPKFKVGNRIQNIYNGKQFTITKIYQDYYECDDRYVLTFENQDIWELVPDKFDITSLIPFESRVLIRNSKDQYWIPAFWGFRTKDGYVATFGHSIYCIPFEGNEHLLGTTGDCCDYYKTWEEK